MSLKALLVTIALSLWTFQAFAQTELPKTGSYYYIKSAQYEVAYYSWNEAGYYDVKFPGIQSTQYVRYTPTEFLKELTFWGVIVSEGERPFNDEIHRFQYQDTFSIGRDFVIYEPNIYRHSSYYMFEPAGEDGYFIIRETELGGNNTRKGIRLGTVPLKTLLGMIGRFRPSSPCSSHLEGRRGKYTHSRAEVNWGYPGYRPH